jgi:hypothetical protein
MRAGPTVILVLLVVALVAAAPATRPTTSPVASKPVDVDLYIPGALRNEKVSGRLLRFDDDGVTIRPATGPERTYKWSAVTPGSAFVARLRLIDKSSAADWLELGRFGWQLGADEQARAAFGNAVRIDPSLRADVQKITASPAGTRGGRGASSGTSGAAGSGMEGLIPSPTPPGPGRAPRARFARVSPGQAVRSIVRSQQLAQRVRDQLGIELAELSTPHFLVYTDCPAADHAYLTESVEAAYSLLSRHLAVPADENVFVGKLPVFVLAKRDDFVRFGQEVDDHAVPDGMSGYYATGPQGMGHMALPQPGSEAGKFGFGQSREMWRYVLTHEFCHAFFARYRTNRPLPRWINEGLAEVITQKQYARPGAARQARMKAEGEASVSIIFDDNVIAGFDYYPVMSTMVRMLMDRDQPAFMRMLDDLKDGAETRTALRKHFGLDYATLEAQWREYVLGRGAKP